MSGFEKQTYTQTPNSLFTSMKDMDECELKVVLYICRMTFGYHRDEIKVSTRKIAEAIGMNTASVDKGGDAAVARGLLERIVDGNKTTVWRAVVSDSEIESPAIQNLNHHDSDNESLSRVKESNKQTKELPTPRIDRTEQEWDELGDKKMVAMVESAQEGGKALDALIAFEKAFGFGRLPWDTTATWQKFAKFVRKVYESSPTAFGDYLVWRGTAGKYSGYSNKKIRENPQAFMDTGWPEFEATRKPSNLQIHTDENGIPETY